MELKRYVLDNQSKIIDTKKETLKGFTDERFSDCVENDGGVLYVVVKTSDNILDLVEKDDMLENQYHDMGVYVNFQYHRDDEKGKPSWVSLKGSRWYVSEVIAIYKKQPNGDYKRYEVKK